MKNRNPYLLLMLVGLAILLATPAFGDNCAAFAYTVGASPGPTVCTLDGGAVTLFNSINFAGLADGTVVVATFLDGGAMGQLSGASFNISPGVNTNTSFSITYSASIVGGSFTSVNDSATPGAVSSYSYTGTGFDCPPNVATCAQDIAPTSLLINSGTFTGLIPPNQTFSLDFSTTATSSTPEPASLLLIGSGLLGIGCASRFRRRKARS